MLIIDLEATCWQGKVPTGQASEIIEIGICTLSIDENQIGEKRSILVRPERSTVSAFCTELTTITQDMVILEGISFQEACTILQEAYPSEVWGSWGNYDRRMLSDQCQKWGVEYPLPEKHINLKQLFATLQGLKKQCGMAQALRLSDLELTGTHHRGGDDAYNIARILQWMIKHHGVGILG